MPIYGVRKMNASRPNKSSRRSPRFIFASRSIVLLVCFMFSFITANGCGSSPSVLNSSSSKENQTMPQQSQQDEKEFKGIVLGQQLADAAEVERQRKAKGKLGKSPIPEGKYSSHKGQLDLLRIVKDPYDGKLAEFARFFVKSGGHDRSEMRRNIDMDQFYLLLHFSDRAAVFALRDNDQKWVEDGLAAIAMIDVHRIDWRDLYMSLSLLNHAAHRVAKNPSAL